MGPYFFIIFKIKSMKRAILILILFLTQIHFFIMAQSVELNDQVQQFVEISTVKNLKNEQWVLGGNATSNGVDDWYFVSLDSIRKKESQNNFFDHKNIEQIIMSDGGIDSGFALVKDDKTHLSRVYVYANSITMNNKYTFDDDEEVLNIKKVGGKVMALGRKIVNSEERAFIKIFQSSLLLEFADYSTPGYFSDYIQINDSTFYATGSSQGYGGRAYNQYFETVGNVLENLESDRVYKIGEYPQEEYFLLKDQTITKVNKNFSDPESVNFESYGKLIDMEVDLNYGYLLFQNEGEAPNILKINTSMEEVNHFIIEDEYFIANDLDLSNDEIGIGGFLVPNIPFNHSPFLYPSTSGFFTTISKNGIPNIREFELEILDVKIEDHEKKYLCGIPDLTDAYQLNLKNIQVTLVNNGTDIIENADFFVEVKGVEECNSDPTTPKYHLQKDNFNLIHLDPGDTLEWRIPAFEFPQNINDSSIVDICIWHTAVENQRDINYENNYFCGEVSLKEGYVEEPILYPTETEFLIYPNPLNSLMKVSLKRAPFESTLIEIYDYVGREVSQKYFIAARAKYKEFDISQLPSGFYYLRISNELFEEVVRVYVN